MFVSVSSYSFSFNGVWSNEPTEQQPYIMTLKLSQSKLNVTGTARYIVHNQGVFDYNVTGFVKSGVAYVRFLNEKKQLVCEGRIKFDDSVTVYFKKSKGYDFIPILSYLKLEN